MRLPAPMITGQSQDPSQLLSLLGQQGDASPMAIPNAPINLEGALGPEGGEQRQAELAQELFSLAKKMQMQPDQSEAMQLIAAAFERFGRSL